MTLRLILVNPGLHRHGGAERCLLGLLEGLSEEDVDARIVVFGEGDLAVHLRELGHHVCVVPLEHSRPTARYRGNRGVLGSALASGPRLPPAIQRMRAEVRRFQADVVHTNGTRANVVAPLLGWGRCATVATLHDLPLAPLERRIMAPALRRVGAVIANSPLVARQYAEMKVHCRVVDNPVVAPLARERAAARHRLGVPRDAFVVASLAHLHWYKGQLDLVEAVQSLGPESHLVLAGGAIYGRPSEEFRQRVTAAVAESPARARIHMTGLQDDASWVYAAADVVAHCSVRPEPFGMVVVEALLARTPVVSSAAGTPGEMLEHGRTALLYPPGDVAALGRCLASVQHDDRLRERLVMDGHAWARGRFTPKRHARSILSVYRELLGAPEASPRRLYTTGPLG